MRRLTIPGGFYCEAQINGAYAALVARGQTQTDRGLVEASPGGAPLYLRLSRDGARFAGQGHDDGQAWEYDVNHWIVRDPIALGVSPVIYGIAGELLVSHGGAVGSQGFRYVRPDGSIATGDQTYGSAIGVSEWTDLSSAQDQSLMIGQGHAAGGVAVFIGRSLRLLQAGACYAIRVNRVGDRVAIAFYDVAPDGLTAFLIWTTIAELAALPAYSVRVPDPVVPPVTPVTPKDPPMALQAPNQIAVVRRVMAEHPEINTKDEATRGALLPYVVAALGGHPWGRKSRNADGTDLNTDGLTFQRPDGLFEIYDVIHGTTGVATWDSYGPFRQGENGYWVPAAPVTPTPTPTPVPIPAPHPDVTELKTALATLTRSLDQFELRLTAVELRPIPSPVLPRPTLRVKGSSGRSFGHSHAVDLEVIE